MVTNRPILISVLIAGATALAANGMPNKLGLLLAALLGVAAGVLAESTIESAVEEKAVQA